MTEPRTGGKRDDRLNQKICEERADELTHKIGEEGADELTLKSDGERVERLTQKIRDERADGLTHKSCEERADGLTLKIDGERVERRTQKIREERADGLTQWLVDDDGSESGGCRWTNTSTTLCLRRTQRKFESSSAQDCVRCEKTWLRMAQVTPSTEFALRKWVESLTWVVTQSGVCSSFVEIENEVHDEECWRGWVSDEPWHDAAAATLTDWKSWNKLAPLLVGIVKAHRKVESKECP